MSERETEKDKHSIAKVFLDKACTKFEYEREILINYEMTHNIRDRKRAEQIVDFYFKYQKNEQ